MTLTSESFRTSRATVNAHDHAVFVYDDVHDMLLPLDHFLADAARQRELAAFVHSFPGTDDARRFLAAKLDTVDARERDGHLTLAHYRDAFERAGRIDHQHAASVVAMLQGTADQKGHAGVRIFVDASKNYFDAGRVEEWFAFERWLGPRLQADAGLVCAYRARDLRDPAVLRQVLETHAYRFTAPGQPVG